MKNILITLSFVILSSTLNAQNKDTKTADKLYNRYEFVAAAKAYYKLVEKGKGDPYVYKQLAESYFNVFNTIEAAKWYEKAVAEPQDAETYYKYAQMLKANGKYADANKQMYKFASMAPADFRAKEFKKDPNYLEKLNNLPILYNIKPVDINSEKTDFGAVLNDNTLYFASARNKTGKLFGWNAEPYLDIYSSNYNNEDQSFSSPITVEELNSKYNDGPLTVSADGNTLYFASESFRKNIFTRNKKYKAKLGKINIFKATKVEGKWGNIEPVPFNNKEYYTCNPSLSQDGKMLYFSSNMPGSLGSTDIWRVTIDADGNFGTPENLGPNVNTEGRESFPFIAPDNKLYFSSDSRTGFGALDVFVVDLNKGTEAKNLGKPLNSEKDDFAFTYNYSKKIGFISSNRNGQDDMFMAAEIKRQELIASVIDTKTGNMIPEALVVILENNKIIDQKKSNAEGKVDFVLEPGKTYVIQVSKPGYDTLVQTVEKSEEPNVNVVLNVNPIEAVVTDTQVILQEIYFEFDKSNITQQGATELDKLVAVMNENPTMEILVKSHTDNRGSDKYNMSLSERRARSTVQYIISKGISNKKITFKGYGETEPKVDCAETCSETEHAQNRRSEFLIVKK